MASDERQVLDTTITPWVDVYRRLIEVVVPRPIAVVSTVDRNGRHNLAPFSFFNLVSANPPCLAFCPGRSGRSGEQKDTLLNIEEVGQFVVAVATEEIAERVNACAGRLPHGESEFDHAGLTPVPAQLVRPPLVAESPVNLECELVEVRSYGDGPGAGNLVVGRIVRLHFAGELLDANGRVVAGRLKAVGRMGGELWVRTSDTFAMPRPE